MFNGSQYPIYAKGPAPAVGFLLVDWPAGYHAAVVSAVFDPTHDASDVGHLPSVLVELPDDLLKHGGHRNIAISGLDHRLVQGVVFQALQELNRRILGLPGVV